MSDGDPTPDIREAVVEDVAQRNLGRMLTLPERRWAREGWVPATLATPGVRE